MAVSGITSAVAITASGEIGGARTCALLADGTASCWGERAGIASNGSFSNSNVPVPVPGLSGVVSLSTGGGMAGGYNTCAVLADHTARCWGANFAGQLGNGTNSYSATPQPVSGLTGVTAISAGGDHTCAVLVDHSAWCWGHNGSGELGNRSYTSSNLPVAVHA